MGGQVHAVTHPACLWLFLANVPPIGVSSATLVVCSSAAVGRGKPGLSRAWPRAMGPWNTAGPASPGRGYAAKARCRQGQAADRPLGRPLPNDDDELPGERGWTARVARNGRRLVKHHDQFFSAELVRQETSTKLSSGHPLLTPAYLSPNVRAPLQQPD